MGVKRDNTVVVDFNILPKRPPATAVHQFLLNELKLNLADVKNIQFSNVRNCVFIEMADAATAARYCINHHLQRAMKCGEQSFTIPVFEEDGAVDVRIHDLPPNTPDPVIMEHMKQYGTILSLHREVWKHYFPGVSNGVRVARMLLNRSIPSYVSIGGDNTLITHCNQTKSCKSCQKKAHPGKKCHDVVSQNHITAKTTSVATPTMFEQTDFPPLATEPQIMDHNSQLATSSKQQNEPVPHASQQSTNEEQSDDNSDDSDETEEFITVVNNKRRLSSKTESEAKKKSIEQGCQINRRKQTTIKIFSPRRTRSETRYKDSVK